MRAILKRGLLAWLLALPAASTAQQEDGLGQIRVGTIPSGAVVACDGVLRDAAPITITGLAPGPHLVTATKQGHREARRTVILERGQRVAVELELEPILGLVLVHTVPQGAEVQIDGAARGRTPLLITDLVPGRYRVRFSGPGIETKEVDLRVEGRTPQLVRVGLTSDTATLHVESRPGDAAVILNGIPRGRTPCTIERVPEGENALEVTLPGYQVYKRTVKLHAGTEETLTAELAPEASELEVVSLPEGARVYLNDDFKGEAPLRVGELQPGAYELRVQLEGFDPSTRTIQIERAQKRVEEFRLTRNTGQIELMTEPAGVSVFVDGVDAGLTAAKADQTDRISEPLRIENLPEGIHEVKLTLKGYEPQAFKARVEAGKTATHQRRMLRLFIPNYEVETRTTVYRGVLQAVEPDGDVRLEVRPGVFKTVPADQVTKHGPLRDDE